MYIEVSAMTLAEVNEHGVERGRGFFLLERVFGKENLHVKKAEI